MPTTARADVEGDEDGHRSEERTEEDGDGDRHGHPQVRRTGSDEAVEQKEESASEREQPPGQSRNDVVEDHDPRDVWARSVPVGGQNRGEHVSSLGTTWKRSEAAPRAIREEREAGPSPPEE
jgi:hypothetical protein